MPGYIYSFKRGVNLLMWLPNFDFTIFAFQIISLWGSVCNICNFCKIYDMAQKYFLSNLSFLYNDKSVYIRILQLINFKIIINYKLKPKITWFLRSRLAKFVSVFKVSLYLFLCLSVYHTALVDFGTRFPNYIIPFSRQMFLFILIILPFETKLV